MGSVFPQQPEVLSPISDVATLQDKTPELPSPTFALGHSEDSFREEDLTSFGDESDFVIAGEIPLNNRLKREARVRRDKQGSGRWSLQVPPGSRQEQRRASRASLVWSDAGSSRGSYEAPGHIVGALHSLPTVEERGSERDLESDRISVVSRVVTPTSTTWLPLHCAPPLQRDTSLGVQGVTTQTHVPIEEKSADAAERGEQVELRLNEKEIEDISAVAEYARLGKPKIAQILRYELGGAEESLLVTCCGPVSLGMLTRDAVASLMKEDGQNKAIEFYSEDFDG